MEKPKRFIRVEKRSYRPTPYGEYVTTRAYHFGRVEISGASMGALIFTVVASLAILQIVVGAVSGWAVFWPIATFGVVMTLWLVFLVLRAIFLFFGWIASGITIHGPGKD